MSARQIHQVRADEVFGLLRSRPQGLAARDVLARLREVGSNRLERPSKWKWSGSLARQFTNFFSILLDVSAVMCFVAEAIESGEHMIVLGAALLCVSVLNALFGFVQEYRAERAMEELQKYLPQKVRVRRDGRECDVLAEELVPGDVLLVTEGERVSADARVVESKGLLINNAPLTGESRSVPLANKPSKGRLLESSNVLFAGSSILRGSGTAVVFATGSRTEFGKVATLARDIRRPASPIQREITRMTRVLTVIAVVMGLLFFGYGWVSGRSLWVNLVFMLGIIVANVPEGLLPTFTLALSMAGVRMARQNVLVKSFEAVEALGAMHVVCTDKTGTLTENKLTISTIADATKGVEIRDEKAVRSFLQTALVASEVSGAPGSYAGDPLDVAVAERHTQQFGPPAKILAETRRHFPFDLERRREAGVYDDGELVLFAVKGAWESLRPLIGQIEEPHTRTLVSATDESLVACDGIVRRLAAQGHRVIAVAYCRLPQSPDPAAPEESLERNLVVKGFLALSDPLRPEVSPAVASCHAAGIRVLLITGDHPDTATAVARQCGILPPQDRSFDGRIVLGDELERLREADLRERLRTGATVFARTTPEQKMKIVAALKRLGYVVGMTGDGVNDAPALKAADVGMAMGIGGTDVAREAADIVLLDDNFASIVAGVREGRAVFTNMQKFTTYVLASNIPEIVPYLLYVALPVPLALTVIQILSIDLGTDLLPAIGLGQEPPEPDVMQQPPRRPDERLLSFRLMAAAYLFLGVIQAAFSLLFFFAVLVQGGWQWGEELAASAHLYRSATGITLSSVILMQIGNVVGRRSRRRSGLDVGLVRNRIMLLGVAIEAVFSWAILYFPPVQELLETEPVSGFFYACAWLGIPLVFGLDLLRKRFLSIHNH